MRSALRLITSHPFTTAVFALVLALALATGPLHGPHRPLRLWLGTGPGPILDGHWWTPLTSLFFADDLGELILALVLVVLLVGVAERLMGTRRTAIAFVVSPIVGILFGIGLQLLGSQTGEMWARNVHHLVVLDVFTAIGGTIMTASAFAGVLWRRRIRVLTVLVALMLVLYSGLPGDLYRLFAVLVGLALGVILRPTAERTGWARSSHHEVRVLLASAVTITAVGPVIGLLTRSRYGLLAPVGLLFTNDLPDKGSVVQRCQAFSVTVQCVHDLTLERINGVGPILVSVLPLLLLLVAAAGLLRGSRFALWLAVAVNGMLGALSLLYFGLLPLAGITSRPHFASRYWEITVILALSALLPIAIAVTLVVLRRHFPVRPPARSVWRYVLTVAIAFVALAGFYVAVGYVLRETGFTRSIDLPDLLGDVLERFVPVNFLRREPITYLPTDPIGTIVYHNVGTVFWLVVIAAAIPVMRRRSSWRGGGDAARVRSLIERGGGDAISFMATWPGNDYWFDPADGRCIAYRVIGRVAITTGGPFGAPPPHDRSIDRFARFCDDNGWTPVFYSVDAALRPFFAELGWSTMVVAEEAVIRPQKWATTGKKWQDIRSSINRAERAGIRAEWTTFAALPLSTAVQLSDISEQWVAEKDLPEMEFTLGGLDQLRDPAVRLMLAVTESGRVEAVTSWLPTYRDGVVIGWTLDFMRRRGDSMNGVMEFLIAESATRMRDDGIEFLSLSAAPLAHTVTLDEAASGMDRTLGRLSASLEPVYGFRSLLRFKRKFQPEEHPLIMAYPDPVALPAIGVALVRAYLPELSVKQAANLARGRG
ncbi:bifunctional lysylphosphatidylglycerol flippase/synthetase MprF [Leifsonia sp. NPDC058292]|uniref:bifunctional lysylphosphatidylglycerol flippase/synthetase MprF n=1 Tax=Leifsonia sp. NPDC058292 TaxID=3346428 RepID=UPI0036DC3C54